MTQARTHSRPTGWLKPSNNRGNLFIEFRLNGTKYRLAPVSKGKYDNVSDYRQACLVCEQIEWDIRKGCFDASLTKYKPANTAIQNTPKPTPIANLKTLWDDYKNDKDLVVEKTTQKEAWSQVDRVLDKCELHNCTDLNQVKNVILSKYAITTGLRVIEDLSAAINHAIKKGILNRNPLAHVVADLKQAVKRQQAQNGTSSCKSFNKQERDLIIAAFETDRFNPTKSRFSHSYYAPLVKFRFLTGTRPEEAIALTWNDIQKNQIHICKAYSKGILKRTKNLENRKIPINAELDCFLETYKASLPIEGTKPNCLVFPSYSNGYICQRTFNRNTWHPVVTQLAELGEVRQYLPSYNCRHTFANMVLENNAPIHVVAKWMGNTVEVLLRKYVSPDSQIQIPSLD